MLNKKIFKVLPVLFVIAILFFIVLTMVFASFPYNDTYYGGGRNMYELIADPNFDTDTVASLVMMILLVSMSLPIHLIYNIIVAAVKKDSPFFYLFPMLDSVCVMIPFAMVMAIIVCDCAHSDGAIPMIITGFLAVVLAWGYFFYNTAHFVVTLIEFIKAKRAERLTLQA